MECGVVGVFTQIVQNLVEEAVKQKVEAARILNQLEEERNVKEKIQNQEIATRMLVQVDIL